VGLTPAAWLDLLGSAGGVPLLQIPGRASLSTRRCAIRDGTVEKEERLSGARWELMAARTGAGLSQAKFARALGVSKRTL
jgi:hypothetical protein